MEHKKWDKQYKFILSKLDIWFSSPSKISIQEKKKSTIIYVRDIMAHKIQTYSRLMYL